MGFLEKFKRDKLALFFLLVIVLLGIFIRLNEFSEVGYWNDDKSTLPTGLLAFHSYEIFPGLSGVGEPILGNIILASGCMLSGEDFSRVSEVKPMFYPGRESLIGKQLINAFPYCHIPMYIFGVLFFLAISVLALILLNKQSSLFAISFLAFYPRLLKLSRWIHVDIFGYFFIALGLLFLWYFYKSEKNKKEILFSVISFIFFGLAFATKLPNGIFLLFAAFIVLEKYKKEALQLIRKLGTGLDLEVFRKIEYDENMNPLRLIKITVYSLISYIVFFLIPFKLNPANLFSVISRYQSINPDHSGLTFNTSLFNHILNFLITTNTLDLVFFLLGIIVLVKLIRSKKEKKEKFLLSSVLLFLFVLIFFKTLAYPRIFLAFSFGLIFVTSLIFSKKYSIFNLHKKIPFYIILTVYIIFSFNIALSNSPHFEVENPLLCPLTNHNCEIKNIEPYAHKKIAVYLISILKENETFYFGKDIIYYYLRHDQGFKEFAFDQTFLQKFNRMPTVQEKIQYFTPDNQRIRYIVIAQAYSDGEEAETIKDLRKNHIPIQTIYLNKDEVAKIYDLDNLKKNGT